MATNTIHPPHCDLEHISDTGQLGHLDAAADDPVIALCAQHADLSRQEANLMALGSPLRAALVARWGEPRHPVTCRDLWGHDPDYHEFVRQNTECNRIPTLITELADIIVGTPAKSVAGVLGKIRVAISLWPTDPDHFDKCYYHEIFALDVLEDAARQLAIT